MIFLKYAKKLVILRVQNLKHKQYEKNYCAGDNFVGPVS